MKRPRILLVFWLCIALIGVRLGGAHLHLCFDGQEPASTLHAMDAGLHHDDVGTQTTHNDLDLTLLADGLSKVSKSSLDLPFVWFLAGFLVLLSVPSTTFGRPSGALSSPTRRPFLRPLLRAPPLTAC